MQAQTARTFLASHDGSRSWLILRSLRELGVPSDLVVAENDPFSADPSFPPHFGRFLHPLVVAHLPAGERSAGERRPLDRRRRGGAASARRPRVAGAPRPHGARGPTGPSRRSTRSAPSEDERDEVDVRLALDAQGDARGTFAVVLRGRDAQELSEALFRIVGAERQRALRDVVLAWLPWANVDAVQLASIEGSWQVSLRADVSVSGYAQLEGAKTWLLPGLDTLHSAWPRARVSSLAATFATRAGRESALALGTRRAVPRAPARRPAQGGDRRAHAGSARREGQARRRVAQADRDRRRRGELECASKTTSSSTWRPGPSRRRSTTPSSGAPTPPTTASWPRCASPCLEELGPFH